MKRTLGAPLGAVASGGQSGVDSFTVWPIFPLNGGGFGAGTTAPLDDVPGGEKTPPGSFFLSFSCAKAVGPGKKFRQVAMPRPKSTPRATYAATSSRFRMVQSSFVAVMMTRTFIVQAVP